MEILNFIAGICSILSLIISIFIAKQIVSVKSNVDRNCQSGAGNIQNNQSVSGNNNNVGGHDVNVG